MNLKITINFNDNKQITEMFNGQAFFETTFVDMSVCLGLTTPSTEELANTLQGLKLRRNRTLTQEQKQAVLDGDLTGDERVVLDIARDDKTTVDGTDVVKDIVMAFKGEKMGNLEDINNFFENINFDDVKSLIFEKV